MDHLTRYMLRQYAGTTLLVTTALCTAVWLAQSLRLVDLIVNRGLSLHLFLYLAALIIPRLIEIVLPVGLFVAILFTLNRLMAESEIVVMRSAGVSEYGLSKPVLVLGGGSVLFLLFFSSFLLPAANHAFKELQFEIRGKFVAAVAQEGSFSTISDSLTIYVRERDGNGEFRRVLIQDERNRNKPITILAERGAFVDTAEGTRFLLANGIRQQFNRDSGKLSSLAFESYTLDLSNLHGAPVERGREPQEMYLNELLFPAPGPLPLTAANRTAYLVEANQRIVTALGAMTFALIPLACLLSGEFNRRGQTRRVFMAIIAAFLFELSDLGLRNLGERYPGTIPLIYVNALLPALACAWVLYRPRMQRMADRLPQFRTAT